MGAIQFKQNSQTKPNEDDMYKEQFDTYKEHIWRNVLAKYICGRRMFQIKGTASAKTLRQEYTCHM